MISRPCIGRAGAIATWASSGSDCGSLGSSAGSSAAPVEAGMITVGAENKLLSPGRAAGVGIMPPGTKGRLKIWVASLARADRGLAGLGARGPALGGGL